MVQHPIAFALFATIVGARAQEAVTLPPPLRVEGAAIAKVDAATTNINWEEATVADLRHLARLPALRSTGIIFIFSSAQPKKGSQVSSRFRM